MKRVFTVCAIVALLVFATTLATEKASAGPQAKVTICHQGDYGPETIVVAAAAVQAHLNHGDNSGACEVESGADQ